MLVRILQGDACSELPNMCSVLDKCEVNHQGLVTSGCTGTFDKSMLGPDRKEEKDDEKVELDEAARELDTVLDHQEGLKVDAKIAKEGIESLDSKHSSASFLEKLTSELDENGSCASLWVQCGGIEWAGPTNCCSAPSATSRQNFILSASHPKNLKTTPPARSTGNSAAVRMDRCNVLREGPNVRRGE